MDYEEEISALKKTILELLDVSEKQNTRYKEVRSQYAKIKDEYSQVHKALMRKDDAYQEVADLQKAQRADLSNQIIKLSELEDVLEDMM